MLAILPKSKKDLSSLVNNYFESNFIMLAYKHLSKHELVDIDPVHSILKMVDAWGTD